MTVSRRRRCDLVCVQLTETMECYDTWRTVEQRGRYRKWNCPLIYSTRTDNETID